MTAEQFRDLAILLCGQYGWTTRIAERLGLDRTTIYRYVTNQLPIPDPVGRVMECWAQEQGLRDLLYDSRALLRGDVTGPAQVAAVISEIDAMIGEEPANALRNLPRLGGSGRRRGSDRPKPRHHGN